MIIILGVQAKVICFKNISKFCGNGQFLHSLQSNKYLDSRTNFKLSRKNMVNNDTTIKTKPFQEQQKMKVRAHF